MLIEKYTENEDWRAGYREACFDLCTGNLDKDKAFELQREDEDCEDCCGECDVYDIAYKHGYSDGLEDGYEEAIENEEEEFRPEEIVLDATPFNAIEDLKSDIRKIIEKMHREDAVDEVVKECWDLIGNLNNLESYLAGEFVIEQYLRD